MKKIILSSLIALATVAANAATVPYASVKVGYLNNMFKGEDQNNVKQNRNAGGFIGAIAGGASFAIDPMFDVRAELEYAYGTATGKLDNGDNGKVTFNTSTIMANVYGDFNATKEIKPYVQLGLGYAIPSGKYKGDSGSQTLKLDNVLAYGFGAGVAYQINDKLAIDLGGKYTIENTKIEENDGMGNMVKHTFDLSSWAITLGARYSF